MTFLKDYADFLPLPKHLGVYSHKIMPKTLTRLEQTPLAKPVSHVELACPLFLRSPFTTFNQGHQPCNGALWFLIEMRQQNRGGDAIQG